MKSESTDLKLGRIKPEDVARKLAAIRNRENLKSLKQIEERPRLVEMLWFVQAMSLRPGGLGKFTEDLIAANPAQLGTKTMRAAKGRIYTAAQKVEIYRETRSRALFSDCLDQEETEAMRSKALKQNAEDFEGSCRACATERIPPFLLELCTDSEVDFSEGETLDQWGRDWKWCFGSVIEALFVMMDRTECEAKKQIAMTQVSKRVFQEMEYALQEKVMVRIEGESGFGKTESLVAWCDGRPGVARMVRVPASNSMKDFMIAVGKALGIECSFGSSVTGLREKVDYVLEHSGLAIVFDECAFLIPRSYVHTSPPPRLEWVRDKIIDRGLPVVLSSTPKKWKSDVARFVKKTGYTLEEFFRRNFLTVSLPSSLSESDMIDAARIHFPQLEEDQLGFIANEARLSQNYLQAVEAISKRARFLSGGKRIGLKIIERAISDVLPGRTDPQETVPSVPLTAHLQPIKPTSNRVKGEDFKPSSLRGTFPESTVAELISADS